MKSKYHFLLSGVLLVCILVFGFSHKAGFWNKEMVTWSEKPLEWDDFNSVDYVIDGFDASINSSVYCPNLITEEDSKVYAYMDPNESERLNDEELDEQLLIHEQYHFNITEYCARLLRKELVHKGIGGLSFEVIRSLKTKYSEKLESLHTLYDSISNHNVDSKMQRYWELKIDDWLRQTSYYKNADIYSYYNFTKNRTSFFRHIYFTFTYKILTSYPVGEKDIKYGETYEILFSGRHEKIVKFYKNGKLTNGGYFNTAIVRIIKKDEGVHEIHYFNSDETYNTELASCIKKSTADKGKNRVVQYFDKNENRVYGRSVFETRWKFDSISESFYSTYYNNKRQIIQNEDGIFHEKKVLDKKERTVLFSGFDRRHKPKNDKEYIAKYELEFNENNRKVFYSMYDENGDFAFHLYDYHLAYEYDERGNANRITSLDERGEKTYDQNGASIYEYTHDLYDREISVKRYNKDHRPIIANDDYFYKVKDYDSLGNVSFEAYYYPEYVLKFTDEKLGATRSSYEGDSIVKEYNVDVYNNIFKSNNKVAQTVKRLDSKMRVIKETYFDEIGNYSKTDDGVVEYVYEYNQRGNKIETRVYDSLGVLREFEADVSTIRWEYDTNGNKLKTTYFNKKNSLAYATDSVTYNVYKYTTGNLLFERFYYDIDESPTEINGAFRTRFYKNGAGLDSLVLEFDSNNELKKGVAITKHFYNKYDNEKRVEYFDSSWRRTLNENGVSAINYLYDKRQLLSGYEYFDQRNWRTEDQYGVSVEKWVMDDMVHTITYEYFDKNLNPVLGEYGYHKVHYEWDDMGQKTNTVIYGSDGNLIEDEYGTAIYKYTLSDSGMIQVIERFNDKGLLARNSNDVAITHYKQELNGLYYLEKELNELGEVVGDSLEIVSKVDDE